MQVLVIGAGVVGLAIARTAALAGHDVTVAEIDRRHRQRRVLAQQRSDPWRTLLSDRYAARAALRARPAHALRILRLARRRRIANAASSLSRPTRPNSPRSRPSWRKREINGVEGTEMIGGNAARAHGGGTVLHRRAVVAGNRHHRQPRLYARAVGRARRPRRHDRVRNAGRAHELQGAALAGAVRRPRTRRHRFRRRRQFRRASARRRWRAASTTIRPAKCRGSFSAKGNYFGFAGKPVFSRLIYPTPVDGGLGVHVTLDLAGRMRFGPDVEWIAEENYTVDPRRAESFYARIRTYWPGLPDHSLVPDYCGIRPKLTGPGEGQADFMIAGPADARHAAAGQSVRHRIAGADLVAVDCRRRRETLLVKELTGNQARAHIGAEIDRRRRAACGIAIVPGSSSTGDGALLAERDLREVTEIELRGDARRDRPACRRRPAGLCRYRPSGRLWSRRYRPAAASDRSAYRTAPGPSASLPLQVQLATSCLR